MFLPREVFFEKKAEDYELGKELLTRYKEKPQQYWRNEKKGK